MDKIARINGRKVVLSYFYERLVAENIKQLSNLVKFEKEEKSLKFFDTAWKKLTEKEIEMLKDICKNIKEVEVKVDFDKIYTDDSLEEDVYYIINNFFKKEKQKWIDVDYVFKVSKEYSTYKNEVQNKVDELAKTFRFKEMDIIDRAIFLLGYIEFEKIKTPKPVILNEMVELSKRYGDEWSYKLINGIWDRLLL